ncbi:MAG: TraM recognition domain-containing protein, partial [Methylocystaceae bacterium]|nr:TraM recognition domain-containing protein [Methylocystaceae bacterium]
KGASHAGLTGNMSALLEPCLAALLRMPDTDLLTLQQVFSSEIKDPLVQKMLTYMPEQQSSFLINDWGKRRYETTKEAVVAKIQSLMNSRHFLNFLCGPSTLDLDEIIPNRSIVCFSLQKGELDSETVSAIGSFTMAILQAYVMRKYKTRKYNMIPIHVFVDECQNFLSPALTEILEELRKFGLHLTLAQQYAGQRMDVELTKSVLGNTAVKIAGFNDEKSTHKEMARVMQEDEATLVKLPKRHFLVKSGDKAAVKIQPPSTFVDRRNCVDTDTWNTELARQKSLYYRKVPAPFIAPTDTEETTHPKPPAPHNLDFV